MRENATSLREQSRLIAAAEALRNRHLSSRAAANQYQYPGLLQAGRNLALGSRKLLGVSWPQNDTNIGLVLSFLELEAILERKRTSSSNDFLAEEDVLLQNGYIEIRKRVFAKFERAMSSATEHAAADRSQREQATAGQIEKQLKRPIAPGAGEQKPSHFTCTMHKNSLTVAVQNFHELSFAMSKVTAPAMVAFVPH
eukprot:IDg12917t1